MDVKVPFGLRGSSLYFVTEVPNGALCDCVCPNCGTPLIAKNNPNNILQPHFQHSKSVRCTYSGMTDIHLMAQQILLAEESIQTPEFRHTPSVRLDNGEWLYGEEIFFKPTQVLADSVELEHWWNGIRPDVRFQVGERDLFIEIAVTHFVEAEKRKVIKSGDKAMLEIDLSDLSSEDLFHKETFAKRVLYPGTKATWINNPKANERIEQQLESLRQIQQRKNKEFQTEKQKELQERKERQRRQECVELKYSKERKKLEPHLDLLIQSQSPQWKAQRNNELDETLVESNEVLNWQENSGLVSLVGFPSSEDWIFETHRVNWQTYIVQALLEGTPLKQWEINDLKQLVVKKFGVIDFMHQLNVAKFELMRNAKKRTDEYIEFGVSLLEGDEINQIVSPFLPVAKYIGYLETIKFVEIDQTRVAPLHHDLESYERNSSSWWKQVQEQRDLKVQELLKEEEREARKHQIRQFEREELKRLSDERISWLVAADRRVYAQSSGNGYGCNCCQLAYLETEDACPCCGSEDREQIHVSAQELETMVNRYRCNNKPTTSVINAPKINIEHLRNFAKQ